jgi:hypothetical protein
MIVRCRIYISSIVYIYIFIIFILLLLLYLIFIYIYILFILLYSFLFVIFNIYIYIYIFIYLHSTLFIVFDWCTWLPPRRIQPGIQPGPRRWSTVSLGSSPGVFRHDPRLRDFVAADSLIFSLNRGKLATLSVNYGNYGDILNSKRIYTPTITNK